MKPEMAVATICEANPNCDGDPPIPIPMGVPLSGRRLPPPCWTPDETSSLIDLYRDKWYSLRRGNLRGLHWQQVADLIHSRCPDVSPPKTAVQCRHKMEKLRKRYRAELLRAKSLPHHRFSSSWIYFSRMDSMEKMNPSIPPTPFLPTSAAFHHHDDDFTLRTTTYPHPHPHPHPHRFRIPPTPNTTPSNAIDFATPHYYGGPLVDNHTSTNNIGIGMPVNASKKRKQTSGFHNREEPAAIEMVDAISMLGQGFLRMEQMKMEMMRETERLRLDLEMQRTQLLLDSQHRIVHAFANAWADIINDIH